MGYTHRGQHIRDVLQTAYTRSAHRRLRLLSRKTVCRPSTEGVRRVVAARPRRHVGQGVGDHNSKPVMSGWDSTEGMSSSPDSNRPGTEWNEGFDIRESVRDAVDVNSCLVLDGCSVPMLPRGANCRSAIRPPWHSHRTRSARSRFFARMTSAKSSRCRVWLICTVTTICAPSSIDGSSAEFLPRGIASSVLDGTPSFITVGQPAVANREQRQTVARGRESISYWGTASSARVRRVHSLPRRREYR